MSLSYMVKHMGQHRGNARLWFETAALNDVGLSKGTRFVAQYDEASQTLLIMPAKPTSTGDRVVSGKEKGGKTIPIIDINSNAALGALADQPAVKVVFDKVAKYMLITKLSSAEMKHARENRLAKGLASVLMVAALCFGGGVMDHSAHAGLLQAGVKSELAMAVEIDGDLLDHAARHNPVVTANTKLYNAPMQELVQDHDAMKELPKVDILVTGIPCSGASISGKSKLGLSCAEDHPEVGHLVVPYLMLVNQLQPAVAVVECVVPYAQTVSAKLMRTMLRDMGYTVQEVALNAWDFGSIEDRKRWFLVAASNGINIDLTNLQPEIDTRPTLGDYLEPLPLECYNTMPGLLAKEKRDIADGKGFKMQIVNDMATKIGVIGKDYNKNRSTEPKVQHPTQPSMLRLLTPTEHARIKGLPAEILGDLSVTAAHQLLGQSVDTRPVKALFQRIGENLKAWQRPVVAASMPYSLGRSTG